MIFGFLMAILIPLIFFYYSYVDSSVEEISTRQIDNIAKKISGGIESVYYLGYPSKTTMTVFIPKAISNMTLRNNVLIYKVNTKAGESSFSYILPTNATGELPSSQGIYKIKIKSLGNIVEVSYD